MAKDAAMLERMFDAIKPKDLKGISRKCLENLSGKIGDALSAQDDEKECAKPPGEKSSAEFERWSREMIARGDEA